ncbi:hypothetical protein SCG7086_DJ_00040, partial [Chlamydiales bacterium SCGC AG-110-P3]
MFGTVGIADLAIKCIIGDLPDERETLQTLYVTVEYRYDLSGV